MGNLYDKMYLPVKITDRKWAEALMEGSVFMRALYEFGCWNHLLRVMPIEDSQKYTRIFSMCRLQYHPDTKQYSGIEERMREFGDTAVILLNPAEFLLRVRNSVARQAGGGNIVTEADEVIYKDIGEEGEWDGSIHKTSNDAWQKETRLYAKISNQFQITSDYKDDLKPWNIRIGNISDIAVMLPLEQMLRLELPPELYSDEVLGRLEAAAGLPEGILGIDYVMFADFAKVKPVKAEIEKWRQILPENNWLALSCPIRGESGACTARLKFCSTDRRQEILILPDKIEYQTTFRVAEEEQKGLLRQLVEFVFGNYTETFRRLACVFDIHLGEVEPKYRKEGRDSSIRHDVRRAGETLAEMIMLSARYEMVGEDIYGAAVFENKWHLREDISTPHNGNCGCRDWEQVRAFCEKAEELAEERVEYMRGEGLKYERFSCI